MTEAVSLGKHVYQEQRGRPAEPRAERKPWKYLISGYLMWANRCVENRWRRRDWLWVDDKLKRRICWNQGHHQYCSWTLTDRNALISRGNYNMRSKYWYLYRRVQRWKGLTGPRIRTPDQRSVWYAQNPDVGNPATRKTKGKKRPEGTFKDEIMETRWDSWENGAHFY